MSEPLDREEMPLSRENAEGEPAPDDERAAALARILSAESDAVPDDPADLVAELHEVRGGEEPV